MSSAPGTGTAVDVLAALPVADGCAVVREGASTIIACSPAEVRRADGTHAFALLDDAARAGFWVGFIAYDLGRSIERIAPRAADDLALPDVVLARYDARLVVPDDGEPYVEGDGPSAPVLARAAWAARGARSPSAVGPARTDGLVDAPWRSSLDRRDHATAVDAILELLRDGECYQVNLTRRLRAAVAADPIRLFAATTLANPAPHAALCTFGPGGPDVAVVSASPELFLRVDGREVVTRPIKGTATDAAALVRSRKDRAENVMIVDLARNDLGRVCEYGSVRVDTLCEVESHPGLHHLVSTVRGRLRPDVTFADLVRATFPPASVTGAPKPRVLQAIEDLEPVRRGVYCGAVGWIDGDTARAELAVAIRTFTVARGTTTFGTGGGIVADSRAPAEWEETVTKASLLVAAASSCRAVREVTC